MDRQNQVGSQWRKWDLHVHTPASIVHCYNGGNEEAWEDFLNDLEKLPKEFKVIGINDYIFVDGYERVLKEKRDNGRLNNIDLILPVVEFRLDKFAGVVKRGADGNYSKSDWNRVNLHVIFDQLEPEVIRQQFLNALVPCYDLIPDANQYKGRWQAVITRESLTQLGNMIIEAAPDDKKADYAAPLLEGFNNLCVTLESIKAALNKHDLKNRYLLAVGKTEWENMKWDDQSIAEKRNVINCADIVFTASENPEFYEKARRKLIESNVLSKLLDCSDAHTLSSSSNKDRIGQCFTWVKADPTFPGLLQAIAEFDQRVYVGDTPPKHLIVSKNRTKYISKLSIHKKAGSPLSDTWFDINIPLNHDLVAVIGNKGSGKSALADIIALIGDTRNYESFSFLNEKRFRDPRNKLASHFLGFLQWEDGTGEQKLLSDNPSSSSVERVKYLPQSYLETLCNELAGQGSSTFDGELRKIIYTHVPEEQRLDYLSLDELLDYKISEIEVERKQLKDELSKINTELTSIENKMSSTFRNSLEQQLETKKKELVALEGAKPFPVDDPLASESAKVQTAAATDRLTELENLLNNIRVEEQQARAKKAEASKNITQITRIFQTIKNYQKEHEIFLTELKAALTGLNRDLPTSDIISLNISTTKLEELLTVFRTLSDSQDALLSSTEEGSIFKRREDAENEIKEIKSKLDEKQRLFLVYKDQLNQWEAARVELQGDKGQPHTIAWYQEQLESLGELPERREKLKTERLIIVGNLHDQVGKIVNEYRTLYQPVQGFVQMTLTMEMPLPLDFDVNISEDGFQKKFTGYINRQAKGSFSGVDESNLLIHSLLKETDFMNKAEVLSFVDKIDDMLHYDRRPEANNASELSVSDQLRKGCQSNEVYDFLFGLEYLKPQYSLTYDKQQISQLSPGERGLLLLVFYLLVDKDSIPLVIDQPEENLDNQTIYKILVTCIKTAKQKRQVIMVTHNPNLAVVCDAEQIIYASCDKISKKFNYISGSIESPDIKKGVIEILEGTEPAFLNRKGKYGL